MTLRRRYDPGFVPPAPVVELEVGRPGQGARLRVRGQMDTGADTSVLPQDLVRTLSLSVTGEAVIRGAIGPGERRSLFRAAVVLDSGEGVITPVLTWGRDYALIGRDLLNRWRILLNGPAQVVEITQS